jgi:general secretion pathway protein K
MPAESGGEIESVAPAPAVGGVSPLQQQGVVLAVLVWFLAAMSLLVAGIVYQARMDARLTRWQMNHAQAAALGDGAIQLALADLLRQERQGEVTGRGQRWGYYELSGARVGIGITPVTGLVDLNTATEELLFSLFAYGAGVGEENAKDLALNVIEWRSPASGDQGRQEGMYGGGSLRHGRFEAVEDLLLVAGIDRAVFDSVRESVYVAQQSQGGVDWVSAPASVIAVLIEGDWPAARKVVSNRAQDTERRWAVPSGLDMSHQQTGSLSLFRVDALVQLGDEHFLRRRWVDRRKPGGDGLPWSFFRSEPVRTLDDTQQEKLSDFGYGDSGG